MLLSIFKMNIIPICIKSFVFQREFIKFLDVIDGGSPQEIVKYKGLHDTSSYDQIIKQYEDQLEKKSNVRNEN